MCRGILFFCVCRGIHLFVGIGTQILIGGCLICMVVVVFKRCVYGGGCASAAGPILWHCLHNTDDLG